MQILGRWQLNMQKKKTAVKQQENTVFPSQLSEDQNSKNRH
jgi:hypothetical protein